MSSCTIHPAVWQDSASIRQVGELAAGFAGAPVTAAACERHHSLICALRPW